ncbi:MAG: hypothetical protein K1X89_23890 [Myxococcaceae bacterium]|nr:hypothetical protein [Myxococcaceae bacterium]
MRTILVALVAGVSACAHLSDPDAERLELRTDDEAAALTHSLLSLDCSGSPALERGRDAALKPELRQAALLEAKRLVTESSRRLRVALARHPDLEYGRDGERLRRALQRCFSNEAALVREAETVQLGAAPIIAPPEVVATVADATAQPPAAARPSRVARKHRRPRGLARTAVAMASEP